MKLIAETKVQTNAYATLTSVPSLIKKAMDIEKGDKLVWTLDPKEDLLTIKVVKSDESSER